MSKKKKGIFFLIGFIVFTSFFIYFGNRQDNNQLINTTHSFGDFYVVEKEHHIEAGEYMEMWVVGYNGAEKEEKRENYRVYIKDTNVYNLIEKKPKLYVFHFII